MDQHSTTAELKSMILTFRVNELQALLSYAGMNRTGKKHELLHRAMELLKSRALTIQIQNKIRELHHHKPNLCMGQMWNNSGNSPGPYGTSNGTMPMMPDDRESRQANSHLVGQQQVHSGHTTNLNYGLNHPTNMNYGLNHPTNLNYGLNHPNNINYNLSHTPNLNYNLNHPANLGYGVNNHSQAQPINQVQYNTTESSNVKFKVLPFFPMLEEIVAPSCLLPASRHIDRLNESVLTFSLTLTQADKVATSAISTNPKQFSRPILLRFCHSDTHSDQDDNFPPNLVVEVNRKSVELPPALHNPNKPEKQIKRPGRHVDITPICKLCPYTKNNILVRWSVDSEKPNRNYVVTVVLVEKLNSDDLLREVQSRGLSDQELTRSMVKEKLTADVDSEIATTVLRGTLICPLGKMRMRTPCRSSQCYHIQCFDALLYLQMNERKPSWICPVCDKPALFKDLMIDGLFTDILNETPTITTEVQFNENGSWSVVPKKEDNYSGDIKPPTSKRQCLESGAVASTSDRATPNPTRKPEIELVCISDSSDEEDDEKNYQDKISQASGSVYSISSSPGTELLSEIPDLPELSPETVDANIFDGHSNVTSSVFFGDFGQGSNKHIG